MKSILIGLPVFGRAWILREWFSAIEKQNYPLSSIGFIFQLGPDDDDTHRVLSEWYKEHPEVMCFIPEIRTDLPHKAHEDGTRTWERSHYYNMVEMRNTLLDKAKELNFDCYFSLDSDLLLETPGTLEFLSHYIDDYDILSPISFMTPFDDQAPSVMYWEYGSGSLAARDINKMQFGRIFEADIVMAAVMMSRRIVDNVRYRWHQQGEDLGFAAELTRNGFPSFCAGNIYAFHAMHKDLLIGYKTLGYDPRNWFAKESITI